MAELTDDEKDAISHRGKAARAMAAWLDAGRDE
jgi:inosine/xanthosine triphosphate pyrophosphatase family protein